ncbi:hypothetical protein [Variovorax sp. LT2P21]|uniref:hypothetical protein n=1 Tax=Variovorax sp. LT2P21 TaxID=3443731 RepID=UPI003F4946AC
MAPVFLCALAGCANLDPVGKFGASGVEVAKAYRPLINEYSVACRQREVTNALGRDGSYDLRAVRDRAKQTCAPGEGQKSTLLEIATVVEGYSNALISLSAVPADVFAADLDAMNGAAKALKVGGADGTALVSAAQAEELELVRRAADRLLEDDLIPRSEAPRVPGNSVGTRAAVAQAIPFRAAQESYLALREDAMARIKVAESFDAAADELLATSDNLAKNYDKLTALGRKDAVKLLIAKVKVLREALKAL